MAVYTLEIMKKIVVSVDAESMKDAHEQIANDDSGFDGAWDRAEAVLKTIGVDPSTEEEKGSMGAYSVDVARTGVGNRAIEVQARSFAEAEKIALDVAGNYEFSDHTSEYTAESVTAL